MQTRKNANPGGRSKKFQLYLKNNDFCKYVKPGAILLKDGILSITA